MKNDPTKEKSGLGHGGTANGMHRGSMGIDDNQGQRTIRNPKAYVGSLSGGESNMAVPASNPMADRGDVFHFGKNDAHKGSTSGDGGTPMRGK